jgi:hypothetical protein
MFAMMARCKRLSQAWVDKILCDMCSCLVIYLMGKYRSTPSFLEYMTLDSSKMNYATSYIQGRREYIN